MTPSQKSTQVAPSGLLPQLKPRPTPSLAGKKLFFHVFKGEQEGIEGINEEEILDGVELEDGSRLNTLVFAALYGSLKTVRFLTENYPFETNKLYPAETFIESRDGQGPRPATLSVLAACRNDPKLLAHLIANGDTPENKTKQGPAAILEFLAEYTRREPTPVENNLLAATVEELHHHAAADGGRTLANFILSALYDKEPHAYLDHPRILALYPKLSRTLHQAFKWDDVAEWPSPVMAIWLQHYATKYVQTQVAKRAPKNPHRG